MTRLDHLVRSSSMVVALVAGLCACGGPDGPARFALERATNMPSADGEVTAAVGPNDNTKISLTVKHLAPPDRVSPGATVYVAWVAQAAGAAPQNVGALQIDASLAGKLETVVPFPAFHLTITAEPSQTVTAPSSKPVLWTRVAIDP